MVIGENTKLWLNSPYRTPLAFQTMPRYVHQKDSQTDRQTENHLPSAANKTPFTLSDFSQLRELITWCFLCLSDLGDSSAQGGWSLSLTSPSPRKQVMVESSQQQEETNLRTSVCFTCATAWRKHGCFPCTEVVELSDNSLLSPGGFPACFPHTSLMVCSPGSRASTVSP